MGSLKAGVFLGVLLLATSASAAVHHGAKRTLLRGALTKHIEWQELTINRLMVRHLVFAANAHRLARVGIDVLPLWENNNRHLLLLAGHHYRAYRDSMISPLHPSHPLTGDSSHHPHH